MILSASDTKLRDINFSNIICPRTSQWMDRQLQRPSWHTSGLRKGYTKYSVHRTRHSFRLHACRYRCQSPHRRHVEESYQHVSTSTLFLEPGSASGYHTETVHLPVAPPTRNLQPPSYLFHVVDTLHCFPIELLCL